jgi:hypothetical protein
MAITFPASPTTSQVFTSGNKSWIWDGVTWLAYGASLSPSVLKVDTANVRVGINNQSPAHPLDVIGRVETRAAATQDGVALVGRAGGSSSFDVALTPTTLTADRTLTLPDKTGTVALTSDPGLIFITEVTASGTAGATNIQDCFSATYDNYRIEVTSLYSSSTANIGFQMLNGTTPLTTATYSHAFTGLSTLGASTNTFSNSFTRASVLDSYAGVTTGTCSFDIMRPFLVAQTNFIGSSSALNSGLNGYDIKTGIAIVETTVSYDGLRISAAAGNISFKARVYGYRQA